MGFALLGADSDAGDVLSYPASAQALLLTDITVSEGGPTDTGYMQEVVIPVLQDAAKIEAAWRNRTWVIELLDERITQIRNLTRRLR